MSDIGQNFTLFQGDDRVLEFAVVDENNIPIDLTGFEVTWGYVDEDGTVVTKSVGSGITIENNVASVLFDSSETSALPVDRSYDHELRIINQDGLASVSSSGKFLIKDSILI